MNAPHLHPPEDLLLAYALGQSAEAVSLALACHLSFCSSCADRVRLHEQVAGDVIERMPAVPVDDDAVARLLARLDEPSPKAERSQGDAESVRAFTRDLAPLPGPLLRSLADVGELRWRRLVPGVRAVDLPVHTRGAVARLVRFRAGFVVPLHDHEAPEHTVVLSGHLHERDEIAGRGDLVTREPGERHTQTISDDDECVALVVNEGPLVPLTWLGWVLKRVGGV